MRRRHEGEHGGEGTEPEMLPFDAEAEAEAGRSFGGGAGEAPAGGGDRRLGVLGGEGFLRCEPNALSGF